MEFLVGFACLLPLLLIPLLGLAVWLGLRQGARNKQQAAAQTQVLDALDLEPQGVWHVGTVAGRPVAVKAQRTARTVMNTEVVGRVSLGIKLVALFPLDVPLSEHLHRNNPGSSTDFARLYYAPGGRPPQDVPDTLSRGLVRWAGDAPDDRVEVGPRGSRDLYAGAVFPDAVSLVRVDGVAREDVDAARAWLEACARRVRGLEGSTDPAT